MPPDEEFDFDEVWATGGGATPNVPPKAPPPAVTSSQPRPAPKVKPARRTAPPAPEEEADPSPSTYVEPTPEFLASLVGMTVDDATWKCLRASVNCRVGIEDGEECRYNPEYFPAYRGGYAGMEFVVEKDIVVGTRRVP